MRHSILRHRHCEPLESRRLLSAYLVTNAADSGAGSLRQAIIDANANPGSDTISFAIGTGRQSIAPASALPDITGPTIIDGTSQPGYAGQPIIEITGSSAGGVATDGLVLLAGDSTVRGLVINRWSGSGIISKDNIGNNVFENNYIGTDLTGLVKAPNRIHGMLLMCDNNRVGGTLAWQRNVISGNGVLGLFMLYSNSNIVQGNYVGVGADGVTPVGNATGIDSQGGRGTLIGGTEPGAGNVISGNDQDGLLIYTDSDHNVVQGNLIGTDYTGKAAAANSGWGIEVQGAYNLIGGSSISARNFLSGNVASGIVFYLGTAHDNLVQGNFIGTDITGTRAIPNVNQGVSFSGDTDVDLTAPGPANNIIGGTTPEQRNIISGNGTGVGIFNRSRYNTISGNYLGTDVTGTREIPNQTGINIFNDSDHNTIGGDASGAGNVIAASAIDGINLGSDSTTVQGNTFGLAADGITAMPTGGHAILTIFSSHQRIGGTSPQARNIFANSADCAVKLAGGTDNRIEGNYIGTDISGITPAGNGSAGVWFDGSSMGLVSRNLIANNRDFGIVVASGTGNAITQNLVYDNGLGIDLNGDGVTLNTPGGPHAGANDLQNFPVISSATSDGSMTVIEGSLNAAPNASFTVEIFASSKLNASHHGDATVYLGSVTVVTDSSGNGAFSGQFAVVTSPGQNVTATATAASDGSTSEFALNKVIVPAPPPAVIASSFVWQESPNTVSFTFTQDVQASLDLNDVVVRNLATGIEISPISFVWNADTRTAIFSLPPDMSDGDYRATLGASGITNANGASLDADSTLDFFVMAADANHDRSINFADLVIVAQNYDGYPRTFVQGDLNRDGKVDFADLVMLAQRYDTTLATPPSAAIAASVPSRTRLAGRKARKALTHYT